MRRLMLLFLLLLAPELALAQGRTYVPFNPGFTAGSGGSIVVPGPLLLPDGSAAAPALGFASDPDTGIYWIASNNFGFSLAGGLKYQFNSTPALTLYGAASSISLNGDVSLVRDAANTLALRNGTNAQTFNVYNTYTDASNYERAKSYWNGNIFTISTDSAGTGTSREIHIAPGSGILYLANTVETPLTDTGNLGRAVKFWQGAFISRSIQGGKSKALTEGAATSPVRISVPQTAAANYGGGSVGYTVYATDGTDSQSLVGDVRFAMVNKAGTESCTVGEIGTPVLAESAGGSTLTCTWTCATAAADTVDLAANCTSSLVQTTFTVESRGNMQKTNTWTPQ